MSSTSKEDAKNMALLFFMDHLMQKNGRRTIHDLSCQFGARGFSEEMREAVGTTQEGLTDFLSQFPSLFVLDGDSVTMTGYGDLAAGGAKASPLLQTLSRDRDYEQEAVEFFEEKLQKFGPELQIKSLLGHRSQSAPEIRLVSGRHVKEFTDFLASHPESFIVEQDRVRLRRMPEPEDVDHLNDVDEDGWPLTGAKAKQRALEFLKQCVEEATGFSPSVGQKENVMGMPLPIDALYKKFCARFSHRLRQEVATNPKELLQFLKLNRHIFFIRSNKVSIVRNRPLGEPACLVNGACYDESPKIDDASSDSSDARVASVTSFGAIGSQPPTVVKSLTAAHAALRDVATASSNGDAVAAVDFKLVALGERRFLSMVAVATSDGSRLFVFDVAHSASILLESGLKEFLEADDFVKVMHDCSSIAALLRQQYQIQLNNVFDTQIANMVLQHQRSGRPLSDIRPISFLTLQRLYHPQSLMFTDTNVAQSKSAKYNWSVRPLTEDMIQACIEDVRFLMPFIYKSMNSALKFDYRALFHRLCNETVTTASVNGSFNETFVNDAIHVARQNSMDKPRRREDNLRSSASSATTVNNNSQPCCACKCHIIQNNFLDKQRANKSSLSSSKDAACQTLASGDKCISSHVFPDSHRF